MWEKKIMSTGQTSDTAEATSVLMQLQQAQKLYGLARDKSPESRVKLAGTISKILEMEVSSRESEMVADVLVEIMRQAEHDIRAALSEQLSVMGHVPLRLVLQLANDDIEIASPVLRESRVLGDMDLVYIIKAKSAEYWRVIATRKHMGDRVIDMLADTGDYETSLALVENMDIRLTEHACVKISDMAQEHEDLAMPLLRREDISPEVVSRLYQYVGEEIKQFIVQNYDMDHQNILETVDRTVFEFRDGRELSEYKPDEQMMNVALAFKKSGKLDTKLMIATLRRGQFRSFVAQFAVFANLDLKTTGQILMQSHGQGLAIACRAFDINKEDFVSMFLLTNQFRNDGRMVNTQEMSKAVSYFNRIDSAVARQIIGNSVVH